MNQKLAPLWDEIVDSYLWLKVWKPMDADAKIIDLRKLVV